jgi:hypothetical protein
LKTNDYFREIKQGIEVGIGVKVTVEKWQTDMGVDS